MRAGAEWNVCCRSEATTMTCVAIQRELIGLNGFAMSPDTHARMVPGNRRAWPASALEGGVAIPRGSYNAPGALYGFFLEASGKGVAGGVEKSRL